MNGHPYTSITRNFRGFNYQKDYDSYYDWKTEMLDQEKKYDDKVEWSILIFVTIGLPIHRFNHGGGFKRLITEFGEKHE